MQGKNIPCNLYSNYFERLTAKKKNRPSDLWDEEVPWGSSIYFVGGEGWMGEIGDGI